MKIFHLLCVAMLAGAAFAQKGPEGPVATPPKGTVEGHVICQDTQRPARLAEVMLVHKPDAAALEPGRSKGSQAATKAPEVLLLAKAMSMLDGSFTLRDIPVGDYYAVAKLDGYVLPIVDGRGQQKGATGDVNVAMANFPVVHVAADRATEVEISIQRGGVIAGRMQFDDGSPVTHEWVRARPVEGKDPYDQYLPNGAYQVMMGAGSSETDDEGRYRIAGLRAGKYMVETTLATESNRRMVGTGTTTHEEGGGSIQQSLTVYGPNKFRKAEAKQIEIRGDERLVDTDIEVNLNALHTVSGRVLGGSDQHALGGGYVQLRDGSDFGRSLVVQPDGTFHFDYVPEGIYKLSVVPSPEYKPGRSKPYSAEDVLKSYNRTEMPVVVGDRDVRIDEILLSETKPSAKDE